MKLMRTRKVGYSFTLDEKPAKKKGKSSSGPNKSEVDPKAYMQALLSVHTKFSKLSQIAFQGTTERLNIL